MAGKVRVSGPARITHGRKRAQGNTETYPGLKPQAVDRKQTVKQPAKGQRKLPKTTLRDPRR